MRPLLCRIDNVWHGRAHSWEKIPWLIKTWKEMSGGLPFVIKGIQNVNDARKCVEVGCDGIVVSNHAGRQVDGAIASLDALENIVEGGSTAAVVHHVTELIQKQSCWRQDVHYVRLWRPRGDRRFQSPCFRRKIRVRGQTVSIA